MGRPWLFGGLFPLGGWCEPGRHSVASCVVSGRVWSLLRWLSQWPSLYKGKAVVQMSVQCLQADIGMEPCDWSGRGCLQADFGLSFAQNFGLTLVALGMRVLKGMP